VEMRRLVILPVQLHDDPVEFAEPGHSADDTARVGPPGASISTRIDRTCTT
jgi:hypothetical protein